MKISKKVFKIFLVIILTVFALSLFPLSINASSPAIYSLDISVKLKNNGSADITEVWDVNVTSGTEWYLVVGNLGDSDISDFSVSENGKTFRNIGKWDIDRSIEQKKEQCGMVDTGDGYELCWGVGSYGKHTFTVSYHVTNLIKSYSDYDGFNWRFVNDELSSNVEKLNVSLYKEDMPFSSENTKVWAFGYKGEIHVNEDGKIAAFSLDELDYNDYCNIMVRFDKGLFNPLSQRDESFDDALLIRAFENSSYSYDEYINGGNYEDVDEDYYYDDYDYDPIPEWVWVVMGLVFIFLPIGIIVAVVIIIVKAFGNTAGQLGTVKGAVISRTEYNKLNWVRKVPFNGDILPTYFAYLQSGRSDNDNSLIGSYILKWLQEGIIEVKQTERKRFLGLGEASEASIVFKGDNTVMGNMGEIEKRLYTMMLRASGGDKILQEKEFYNYSKDHYESVFSWLKAAEKAGKEKIRQAGGLSIVRKKVFFRLIEKKDTVFNEKGHRMVVDTLGFKKYLEEFTLINEREAKEVELWDEYLVFAALFGIADKVANQFKNIYPKYFEDLSSSGDFYMGDYLYTMSMINDISRAAHRGANMGRSADSDSGGFSSGGGGGFSSSGGGGGFSGGGSGGGSR